MILPQQQLYFPEHNNKIDENLHQQLTILISKYDTILNFVKQMNLVISVTVRQLKTSTRDMLKAIVLQLDKTIQDYNNFHINVRMKHAIYFCIEPLAISISTSLNAGIDKAYYFQPSYNNSKLAQLNNITDQLQQSPSKQFTTIAQNQNYLMKVVYTRFLNRYKYVKYALHFEIWKKNNVSLETNSILSRYEQLFTFQLFNKLFNDGFVSHLGKDLSVHLLHKKPKINYTVSNIYSSKPIQTTSSNNNQNSSNNSGNNSNTNTTVGTGNFGSNKKNTAVNIIEYIEIEMKHFLQLVTDIFKGKKDCMMCNRLYIYDAKKNCMIPPTVRVDKYIDRTEYKMLHEVCVQRYMTIKRREDIVNAANNTNTANKNERQQSYDNKRKQTDNRVVIQNANSMQHEHSQNR